MNKKYVYLIEVVLVLVGLFYLANSYLHKEAASQPITDITPKETVTATNTPNVAENPEGEADPSRMTLGMKKWIWVKTQMNDGKVITPKKAGIFGLTFSTDGRVAVSTDCNAMGGSYKVTGKVITINQIISTQMFCEGSQEQEFAKTLGEITSYMFTNRGELIMEIKMDSGTMIFR